MTEKEYRAYRLTPHWKKLKATVKERSGGLCEWLHCQERMREVHHLTYARRGWERLDDLVALCRRHHEAAHAGTPVDLSYRRDARQEKRAANKWLRDHPVRMGQVSQVRPHPN